MIVYNNNQEDNPVQGTHSSSRNTEERAPGKNPVLAT